MKFTVEHKAIKPAIATAMLGVGAVGRTIPILACVLLRAADNVLTISGSDMDVWATGTCSASVAAPGAVSVDAVLLGALINSCPAGSLVEFRLENGKLAVSAGRVKASFSTFEAELFPAFTPPDAPTEVTSARKALEFCAMAAEMDQSRPHIQGISFGGGFAVGTNGQKLAAMPIDYAGVAATVPLQYVPVILKAMGEDGRLFLGETVWRVEAEGATMSGKLIGLEFINWRVIPTTNDLYLTCDSDALISAVKTACLGKSSDVLLSVVGPDLVVSGYGFNMSAAESCETAIACDGVDGAVVCFDADYLQTLLGGMAGLVVNFSGKGMSPQKITAEGFAGYAILMPKLHIASRAKAA